MAHEQFIKGELYQDLLKGANDEISQFRRACEKAGIPEIKAKKSLRDILSWTLNVLKTWKPRLTYNLPEDAGAVELDLFGNIAARQTLESKEASDSTPRYVSDV